MTSDLHKLIIDQIKRKQIDKIVFNKSSITSTSSMTDLAKNANYVDEKVEFKSILTEFNTNNFFDLNQNKKKFLYLIFTVVDSLITSYKQINALDENKIIFFYKGGNIMRILANHISVGHDLFKKEFEQYFKKSDDDFAIMINENNPIFFQKYLTDINSIVHQSLILVRDILEKQKKDFFGYFNKSDEQKIILLQKLKSTLNNSETIKNKDSPHYNLQFDCILFDDIKSDNINLSDYYNIQDNIDKNSSHKKDFLVFYDNNNNSVVSTDETSKHLFYNYFNSTLEFKKQSGLIVSFDLFRTKANFRCFFTLNGKKSYFDLGGELIDIAIPKFNDVKRNTFMEYIKKYGITKFIKQYQIKDIPNNIFQRIVHLFNKPFYIHAITMEYILEDLESILFIDQIIPWDDKKYTKRLARMFYTIICINLYSIDTDNKRINNIVTQYGNIKELINNIMIGNNISNQINIFKNTIFEHLVNKIYFLLTDSNIDRTNDFESGFKMFLTQCNKYIDISLMYFKNLIETNNLKYNDTSVLHPELFGGYHKKYLKYKKKYLMLRNSIRQH